MGKRTLLIILIVSFCTLSLSGLSQIWTCPMHPEIKQSSPGTCPKCKMKLVQVSNNTNAPASSSSSSARTRALNLQKRRTAVNESGIKNKSSNANVSVNKSKTLQTKILSLETIRSKELPLAIVSLGEVVKAIQSGNKQTELSELYNALGKLLSIYDSLKAHANTQFANSLRCPIMGSSINPEDVTNNLIREYKGKKIAFCCSECPLAWDRLSNIQKKEISPYINP